MPHGQHVARCLNCGKEWVVGDCIPTFCSTQCHDIWYKWWDDLNARIRSPAPAEPEPAPAEHPARPAQGDAVTRQSQP